MNSTTIPSLRSTSTMQWEVSRGTIFIAIILTYLLYLIYVVIFRLYRSPIAKFPGPKLAALTRWYEFYYEVILRGQFSDHIADLHKKYGPIIRVTPEELHISDPPFFETLFTKNPKSVKDPWFNSRFGAPNSVFSTCDAAHHKLRRAALNPYFSKRAINQCEDIVQSKIEYACNKVSEYKNNGKILNLTSMWDTYSTDVIMEYSFGFSYNNLESEDFSETFHEAFLSISEFGGLACQFPIMGPMLECLPDWLVGAMNPTLRRFLTLVRDLSKQVDKVKAELKQGEKPSRPTVFHEMLSHNLPPEETTPRRMRDEAETVVGAGLVTTAWSLSNACFYLIENETAQRKLREELKDAIPDILVPDAFNFRKLEDLPYLRGCVKEGIRLSTGVSGRNSRIWRMPLQYREWIIPAGTTMSMNHQDILFDDEIFPKPEEFVPERWIGHPKAPDGSSLERYFVPFGKGDRQCLGINLAFMEIFLGLAHLFRKFQLELSGTDRSDLIRRHDFFIPSPKTDAKGVRAKVVEVFEK